MSKGEGGGRRAEVTGDWSIRVVREPTRDLTGKSLLRRCAFDVSSVGSGTHCGC